MESFSGAGKDGRGDRSIRTAFTTACRHAKLRGVSPHTLRHTFASRLTMAGVGIRTLQELGGWKEIKMVERYAHLSQRHKADAVEKVIFSANCREFHYAIHYIKTAVRVNPFAPVAQLDRASDYESKKGLLTTL